MQLPGIVLEAGKDGARCCHRSRDCGVALAGVFLSLPRLHLYRLLSSGHTVNIRPTSRGCLSLEPNLPGLALCCQTSSALTFEPTATNEHLIQTKTTCFCDIPGSIRRALLSSCLGVFYLRNQIILKVFKITMFCP